MKKIKSTILIIVIFIMFVFTGCSKSDILWNVNKLFGINTNQEKIVTEDMESKLPNDNNTHYFGNSVIVDENSEVFNTVEYRFEKISTYKQLDTNTFDKSNFFENYAIEVGYISNDYIINPEYSFVVVNFKIKNIKKKGDEKPILVNNLLLLTYDEEKNISLASEEMVYFALDESGYAKRDSNPNDFFGVFLEEGKETICTVGFFINTNSNISFEKLFLVYGLGNNNPQYFFQEEIE